MTNLQALEIIKQVMDAATKGGVFNNLDATFTAAQAFNLIANEINKKENGLVAVND